MRSGRMLAEDEPSILLDRFNQTTLENVFLQLCYDDQNRLEQENFPINENILQSNNQRKQIRKYFLLIKIER